MIEIGGETFESLRQTAEWVRFHLPSSAYFDFMEFIALLDVLGGVYLSNKDFIEEKYHVSCGRFKNEIAARFHASFSREIPHFFGRIESSSSIQSSSSHPLPSVKEYGNFNALVSHSGVK